MAFRDNVGVAEELKVEMVDCDSIQISRAWLGTIYARLLSLQLVLHPRPKLDELIADVKTELDRHE